MIKINPIFPLPILLALFALGLAFTIWNYRKVYTLKSINRKLIVIGLHTISFLCLLYIALRPSTGEQQTRTVKDSLYILNDISDSMTLRDMPNRQPRKEFVSELFESNEELFEQAKEKFNFHNWSFSAIAGDEDKVSKSTHATAIGTALHKVNRDLNQNRGKAVFLFSDGQNNSGLSTRKEILRLKQKNVPIYTIAIGQKSYNDSNVDASVDKIENIPPVAKDQSFSPLAKIKLSGLRARKTKVTVKINGKKVFEDNLQARNDEETILFEPELSAFGLKKGFHKLEIFVQKHAEEITPLNNDLSSYFEVKDDGLKVLLLSSAPTAEYKFLRRVLSTSEGISLNAPNPFLSRTTAGRAKLQNINCADYNIFIFVDTDYQFIPKILLGSINLRLKDPGTGVLTIAGPSFKRQWQQIANNAPLLLPIKTDGVNSPSKIKDISFTSTTEGREHFVTSFINELPPESRKEIAKLKGFQLANFTELSGSQILFEDSAANPLLIARSAQTRQIFLATPSLWRHALKPELRDSFYRRLWYRSIFFLAGKENDLNSKIRLYTGKTRYSYDEQIEMRASVLNGKGQPVSNVPVQVSVTHKETGEQFDLQMKERQSNFNAQFLPLNPGLYTLQARADVDGQTLKSREVKVFVMPDRKEFSQLITDEASLKRIAETTEGSLISAEDFPAILKNFLENADVRQVVTRSKVRELWDNIYVLLILLTALSLEWIFRRKFSLP